MGHVESCITTSAPAEFAFAYTSDYRNLPKWMLGISRVDLVTEQPSGVGIVVDTAIDLGPKKLAIRLENVEWVEGKVLGFKTTKGLTATTSWRFDPLADGGSKITAIGDYKVDGLAGKVLDKILEAFFAMAIGHVKKHLSEQVDASYAETASKTMPAGMVPGDIHQNLPQL
jgi:uncharacterized membrane protein